MADENRPEESEGIEITDIEQAKIVNMGSDMIHAINMNFIEVEGFGDYAKKVNDIEELRSSAISVYNRLLWAEALFEKLLREE
jgi:hypothetical protein